MFSNNLIMAFCLLVGIADLNKKKKIKSKQNKTKQKSEEFQVKLLARRAPVSSHWDFLFGGL